MVHDGGPADHYHLTGQGIDLTYHHGDGKLEASGDDGMLSSAGEAHLAARRTETGLVVTATLLPSDRAGRRYMMALLLPEVHRTSESGSGPFDVTGVVIRTIAFLGGTSIPEGAVQQFTEVLELRGTASFDAAAPAAG